MIFFSCLLSSSSNLGSILSYLVTPGNLGDTTTHYLYIFTGDGDPRHGHRPALAAPSLSYGGRPSFGSSSFRRYVGCTHTSLLAWLCVCSGCLLASFRLVHVCERARVGKSPLICRRPVVMGFESVKRGLVLGGLSPSVAVSGTRSIYLQFFSWRFCSLSASL
jgi:hypothetical protein